MNKKILIIGGGVLLLGGIAYLYFKNKKKQDDLLANGVSGAGSTTETVTTQTNSTSSANSGVLNPLSVLDVVYTEQDVNLDKAKEIVKQILKPHSNTHLKRIIKNKLTQQLKDLGYVYNESTGVLTKL